MTNKGKNRQMEIDEKSPNPKGTEEENRSAAVEPGYNIFIFLFRVLVASQPRFCLVVLVGLLRSQAIGGALLTGGEVAVGLLELSL